MVKLRDEPCIAVIADMVKSRDLPRTQRSQAQMSFSKFITTLNRKYHKAILASFIITIGDEFQGLLSDATVLPDLLWDMQYMFHTRRLRVGVGFGTIDTPIRKAAINIDGPALHRARESVEASRKNKLLGGVFIGFADLDPAFNGFARLLQFHRSRLKPQQRKVISMLRQSLSQSDIAKKLGVTRQAVSLYAASAGWDAYKEGENGWRSILSKIGA
jgi:hypothetical protein